MKRAIILTAVTIALALGATATVLTITPQSAVACSFSNC
jgi:hypothetical protein